MTLLYHRAHPIHAPIKDRRVGKNDARDTKSAYLPSMTSVDFLTLCIGSSHSRFLVHPAGLPIAIAAYRQRPLCPQAFASWTRQTSPFSCAPGYGVLLLRY